MKQARKYQRAILEVQGRSLGNSAPTTFTFTSTSRQVLWGKTSYLKDYVKFLEQAGAGLRPTK